MNINLWMAAITYAASIILLSLGFSLTYQSTKAPNFTIGPIMAIGSYVAYTTARVWNIPVYLGSPLALILGFMVSSVIYMLVIKPLVKRKRDPVLITLALIGLGEVLTGLTRIYAIWIQEVIHFWAATVLLKEYDFFIGSVPGVFLVFSAIAFLTYILWSRIYSGNSFGSAYRATVENPELVMVQGLNPDRVWLLVWGFSGGLACLSGYLSPLWFKSTPLMGPYIMTTIIAASLLGGLYNRRGYFIGGLILGIADIMLTVWGQEKLGVWVGEYRPLVSMVILVLVLRFRPQGLLGREKVHFLSSSRNLDQ